MKMWRLGLPLFTYRLTTSAMWSRCFQSLVRLDAAVYDHDFSKLLYTRLSVNDKYQYLDPNIETEPDPQISGPVASRLILAIKQREEGCDRLVELEEEALQSFKDWARNVQLRVGFLLHLNNKIDSREYLTRVIQLMAAGDPRDLEAHELITLLLLIYFRKDFTVEEISEYLDLQELQVVFAQKIDSGKLNHEEICAGCLGLKKIKDMRVDNTSLRWNLYRTLNSNNIENSFKDFFIMTVMTTLAKGNQTYHDTFGLLETALDSFYTHCDSVSLMTAVKMMSFGINSGVESEKLNAKVSEKILKNFDALNTKDVSSITNFYSKSENHNMKILLSLKGKISECYDSAQSIEDLSDVLKSLSYMCINEVYRLETIVPFLNAFSDTDPSEVSRKNLPIIAERILRHIANNHPNGDSILINLEILKENPSLVSTLCRIPAFLCFNLRLDGVDAQHEMNMDTAAAILSMYQKKIPLQFHSPQMSSKGLENRSRLLVNCYRGLASVLGSERYVGVARILPQFPEPDLVFGNIGGTPTAVPQYITDPKILRPKRAPAGDWWVLIMANRKNLSQDNKIIGIDEIKVRQLKKLGFTPVVIPYSNLTSVDSAARVLPKLLRIENVKLPNLDDGYIETTKKF